MAAYINIAKRLLNTEFCHFCIAEDNTSALMLQRTRCCVSRLFTLACLIDVRQDLVRHQLHVLFIP